MSVLSGARPACTHAERTRLWALLADNVGRHEVFPGPASQARHMSFLFLQSEAVEGRVTLSTPNPGRPHVFEKLDLNVLNSTRNQKIGRLDHLAALTKRCVHYARLSKIRECGSFKNV